MKHLLGILPAALIVLLAVLVFTFFPACTVSPNPVGGRPVPPTEPRGPQRLVEREEILQKSMPSAAMAPPPAPGITGQVAQDRADTATPGSEEYSAATESAFKDVTTERFSTFSADVDTASYTNVRRMLNTGALPPPDAVRVEEFVNFFDYRYNEPSGSAPFAVSAELSACPWNSASKLLVIGLQTKRIQFEQLPACNLVFLLDVSGSMSAPNKLPLLKQAFRLLVQQLRPQDRVSIVTYAGAAGLVLAPTPGNERQKILDAIDLLQPGGSTAGAQGIFLAYQTAREAFIQGGTNRVIIGTDGDFNVGPSSQDELEKIITTQRDSGIFLTVLGFGMGNYKDARMETLANKGNGAYGYIDTIAEARRLLVQGIGASLVTVAKDVKIQAEFNPAVVKRYRLVGYDNRLLRREDFTDDTRDAGEVGSGHSVTVIYEIELTPEAARAATAGSTTPDATLMTLRYRYKPPQGNESTEQSVVIPAREVAAASQSDRFKLATAVAEFALLLKNSAYKGTASWKAAAERAEALAGQDRSGYIAELAKLIRTAASIPQPVPAPSPQR